MTEKSPEEPFSTENKQSESTGIINLLSSWINAQKAITGAGSKLLLADSKLAAVSVLQIAILGILASMLLFSVWVLLCVLLTLALLELGLSLGTSLVILLIANCMLLALAGWAINSSLIGMRFETSRALLRQVKNEITPPEN